jgi:hypothetical protein
MLPAAFERSSKKPAMMPLGEAPLPFAANRRQCVRERRFAAL